jgi:hypothetical protein
VTRRPRSRLPPKLPDPARDRAPTQPKPPTRRERLKDAHAAGRSAHWSSDAVVDTMRALVRGEPRATLGLPPFAELTMAQAAAAADLIFGWDGDGPRARIDPARTVNGFTAACTRVLEIARGGGRIAFATGRPASLLGLHRALADVASAAGGEILGATQSGPIDARGRRIWWVDGVATVSDGESLLAEDSPAAPARRRLEHPVDRQRGLAQCVAQALGVGMGVDDRALHAARCELAHQAEDHRDVEHGQGRFRAGARERRHARSEPGREHHRLHAPRSARAAGRSSARRRSSGGSAVSAPSTEARARAMYGR